MAKHNEQPRLSRNTCDAEVKRELAAVGAKIQAGLSPTEAGLEEGNGQPMERMPWDLLDTIGDGVGSELDDLKAYFSMLEWAMTGDGAKPSDQQAADIATLGSGLVARLEAKIRAFAGETE